VIDLNANELQCGMLGILNVVQSRTVEIIGHYIIEKDVWNLSLGINAPNYGCSTKIGRLLT